ncbi:PQQ-binding-like beta-propeller repeat protein [Actinoplanes sp. NPDC026670]|uniref:outer membrane protein assembly factor BamB family protein n=1 Tax=Actinoplanes sp. NPDC026670 TaxID=3154700 RepID=UPI00340EC5D0
MYRGGPDRCGVTGSAAAADGFVPWRFKATGPIKGSPAVAGGVAYVCSLDGVLYALDAMTGRFRWRYQTRTGLDSTPAVADEVVYIGGDGHLHAIDARTGRRRWRFPIGDSLASSPAVADGLIYVGAGDCRMVAVDTSGTLRWEFTTDGFSILPGSPPQLRGTGSSPAFDQGTVYFVGVDGCVYALAASTGKLRWSTPVGGSDRSSVAIHGGTLFVGAPGSLFALDAGSGEERWVQHVATTFDYAVPAVADDTVYIAGRHSQLQNGTPSTEGDVYAFDTTTGRRRWQVTTASWIEASPAVGGGLLYLATRGSSTGPAVLAILDATTGELRWERQADFRSAPGAWPADGIRSSPAVANGVLYLGYPNGYLYACRAEIGAGIVPPDRSRRVPSGKEPGILRRIRRRLLG